MTVSKLGIELKKLLDDTKYWIEHQSYDKDEIAIPFKHRIVAIHCFANGNGRHSRLIADIIVNHLFSMPVYTWGSSDLVKPGEARKHYLTAIRAADKGDFELLIAFARTVS